MQSSHFVFQSLVPVRRDASDRAEMVTQLLFGDLVEVLEEKEQWRRVRNVADGYEGWVDEKMIALLPEGFLENISHWEVVLSVYAPVLVMQGNAGLPMKLGFGCRAPILKGQEQSERIALDFGAVKVVIPRSSLHPIANEGRQGTVRLSEEYLLAPYLWGGKSLWGIDCSGFTQMVYGLAGRTIPRDADQQVEVGVEVDFKQQQPGDLAFFRNDAGRIHHVGLVLADGQVRHAHGNVHDDWLRPSGIENKQSGKLTHKLFSIRRID